MEFSLEKTTEFNDWFDDQTDKIKGLIWARFSRIENAGHFGIVNSVGDGVFEHIIVIPDGAEFKFLGQQDWSGMEWGNIHTGGNSGFLGPNGDNNNIQYNGGGNTYVITANIKLGIYKVTPQ